MRTEAACMPRHCTLTQTHMEAVLIQVSKFYQQLGYYAFVFAQSCTPNMALLIQTALFVLEKYLYIFCCALSPCTECTNDLVVCQDVSGDIFLL